MGARAQLCHLQARAERRSTVAIPEPGGQATGSQDLQLEWLGLATLKRRSERSPHPVRPPHQGRREEMARPRLVFWFSDRPWGICTGRPIRLLALDIAHAARCSDRPPCCGISAIPTEACSAHDRVWSTLLVAVAACVLCMADAVWS